MSEYFSRALASFLKQFPTEVDKHHLSLSADGFDKKNKVSRLLRDLDSLEDSFKELDIEPPE